MSDTDSFIEEVSEEVRRDRLYGLIRRYGWIAVLAVLLLVGGAAWNEWTKAKDKAAAEALGDGIVTALEQDSAESRARALAELPADSAGRAAILALLQAASQEEAGNVDAAVKLLQTQAANGDVDKIYRDIAGFKALLLQADSLPAADLRLQLEALVSSGSSLRLLAEEQLALIELSDGSQDNALARLERIAADAEASAGLRRRASQLIVALGGGAAQANSN